MAYPAYQHYKPARASGVTQLPRHWNEKRLRFAVRLNPSRNEVGLPGDALVSFVPMDAVGELGGLTLEAERQLDEAGAGYTYFADGDVVVAKITPCFENGKGAVASGLTNGVGLGTTELHVVRAGPELDARFLFYLSISDHFRDIGESEMYGASGQKRIPDTFIKDFRAGLPPRPEQHIIVEFLGRETARIDALIGKKRRLLELLEEKRLAVIAHAVTKGLDPSAPMKDSGIDWLGQIPAHWAVKQLRHMTKPGTIITYGIVQAGPDVEDGIPYIRTSDMTGDELPEEGYLRTSPEIDASYARSKVAEGDLVIAIRATIGKPLIVPSFLDGANLTQGTAKYSPSSEMSAHYVRYFLRSQGAASEFGRLSKGATFKEITLEMLRKFTVLQPPYQEQEAIANWLDATVGKLRGVMAATSATVEHLLEYRSALITNAVTGKIDVRGAVERKEAAE